MRGYVGGPEAGSFQKEEASLADTWRVEKLIIPWILGSAVLAFLCGLWLRRRGRPEMPSEVRSFLERFREIVESSRPSFQVLGPTREGFGAVLKIEEQEWAVPLGELYLRERAFPGSLETSARKLCDELEDLCARVEDLPFEEAAGKILPQIRTREWIEHCTPAFGPGAVVHRPLFEDLSICFVLDEGDAMVFLTRAHLEFWGREVEDLWNLANANLSRLAEEEGGLPAPEEEGKPGLKRSEDGYAATRLLLAMDRERLDEVRGLVFGIPDRDTLLVAKGEDALPELMREVREQFGRGNHPLSRDLFRVGPEGLRRVSLPAEEGEAAPGRTEEA